MSGNCKPRPLWRSRRRPPDLSPRRARAASSSAILDHRRAGIIVLFQPQQANMPGVRRGKAAHLDVVPHQVIGPRQVRDFPLEVLLLRVPAGTPAQHAADVQILPDDVPHHVGRRHPFGRAVVVCTAGRMHVMVARIPVPRRRMNPALEVEILACCVVARPLTVSCLRLEPDIPARAPSRRYIRPAEARPTRRRPGRPGCGRRNRERAAAPDSDRCVPTCRGR